MLQRLFLIERWDYSNSRYRLFDSRIVIITYIVYFWMEKQKITNESTSLDEAA